MLHSTEKATISMVMALCTGMEKVPMEEWRSPILLSSKFQFYMSSWMGQFKHFIFVFRVKISGTFEDVTVLNSPAQAISVGNDAALTISGVTVDNSAGDTGDLGHNTDVCDTFFPASVYRLT